MDTEGNKKPRPKKEKKAIPENENSAEAEDKDDDEEQPAGGQVLGIATERIELLQSSKDRHVLRQVLLKFYSPVELKQLTFVEWGLTGSLVQSSQGGLFLCVQVLETVFPAFSKPPAGSGPTNALLMQHREKREKEIRHEIALICQYFRDSQHYNEPEGDEGDVNDD